MDGSFDTGYEDKFDFPERAGGPEIVYLLASIPRSGSSFVSHLLWECGCLGAPLEYLNFDPAGPYGFADDAPAEQAKLWDVAVKRRVSPNGVFGLKAFPRQMQAIQQQNPALMAQVMRLMLSRGSESKVVQLKRRDRTAHAISYARAILSGIWRQEQETGGRDEPEYSAEALQKTERLISEQEGAWEAMYREIGITPKVIWYEDALDDPANLLGDVATYLEVQLDSQAKVAIPQVKRQSQDGAQVWAKAHLDAG